MSDLLKPNKSYFMYIGKNTDMFNKDQIYEVKFSSQDKVTLLIGTTKFTYDAKFICQYFKPYPYHEIFKNKLNEVLDET